MPLDVTTRRMLHVDAGQSGRLGADANDQVVELVALITGDDRVAVDGALRAHDFHAFALARRLDALAHGEDDLFLALHHPREVDLGLGNANAERCRVADLAEQIGSREQRLGGNAAPVQAGAAQLGTLDHA